MVVLEGKDGLHFNMGKRQTFTDSKLVHTGSAHAAATRWKFTEAPAIAGSCCACCAAGNFGSALALPGRRSKTKRHMLNGSKIIRIEATKTLV